jgi:hypothetical protein
MVFQDNAEMCNENQSTNLGVRGSNPLRCANLFNELAGLPARSVRRKVAHRWQNCTSKPPLAPQAAGRQTP